MHLKYFTIIVTTQQKNIFQNVFNFEKLAGYFADLLQNHIGLLQTMPEHPVFPSRLNHTTLLLRQVLMNSLLQLSSPWLLSLHLYCTMLLTQKFICYCQRTSESTVASSQQTQIFHSQNLLIPLLNKQCIKGNWDKSVTLSHKASKWNNILKMSAF